MKRIKYLNRLEALIRENQARDHSNEYEDSPTKQVRTLTGIQFNSGISTIREKKRQGKQVDVMQSKSLNQSSEFLPYANACRNGRGLNILIEEGGRTNLNRAMKDLNQNFQSQEIIVNQDASFFPTEVIVEDSFQESKKKIKMGRSTTLNQSYTLNQSFTRDHFYPQSSLLHPLILSKDYTSPLVKYMRARDLAEKKAKEKIDRLNSLIEKWEKKDQKVKEQLMENLLEKKYRADQRRQKQEQAKQKFEKQMRDLEERSTKQYQGYLRELKNRRAEQERRLNESSQKEYQRMVGSVEVSRLKHNRTEDNIAMSARSQDSRAFERRHSDTSIKLESIERKMQMAQERSIMIKKSSLSNTLHNRYPEVQKAQEETIISKLSKYLDKMKKHDKVMSQKLEYQKYQQEEQRRKLQEKHQNCSQMKQEYEKDLDRKRKKIMDAEQRKDETVGQTKFEIEIQNLKKSELAKLKMQDLREQYEEIKEIQRAKKEKILIKHESMERNIITIKENEKLINQLRAQQAEERRRFMEQRQFPSPYEEMKSKYLKSEIKGSKKGKGQDSMNKSYEHQSSMLGVKSSGQL